MRSGYKNNLEGKGWCIDFRDEVALPDMRMVKTRFMLMSVVVGFVFLMVVMGLLQGYEMWVVGEEEGRMMDYVKRNEERSKKYLMEDRGYREIRDGVEGVRGMYREFIDCVECMVGVTEAKPGEMKFKELSYMEGEGKEQGRKVVRVNAEIRGDYELALERVDGYIDRMKRGKYKTFEVVESEILELKRDMETQVFNFQVKFIVRSKNGR